MKSFILIVIGLGALLIPLYPLASPAKLGGEFADAYTAFAPMYALYQSYADYLFSGTAVVIPAGIGTACQTVSQSLSRLQIALVTEKKGNTEQALTYLVRGRQALDSFCSTYASTIEAIAAMPAPDITSLNKAAKAGFFAAISTINNLMGRAFDRTLTGLPDDSSRWRFSATFATRTLLDKRDITRIGPTLSEILLGSPDTPPPPPGLSPEITAAVHGLAAYSGKKLTTQDVAMVKALANTVYRYLIGEP